MNIIISSSLLITITLDSYGLIRLWYRADQDADAALTCWTDGKSENAAITVIRRRRWSTFCVCVLSLSKYKHAA
jgi:hypothetical protein